MRSLRVAILDEELPFRLTSGKRIRTFNLLARLASRHQVTILCHRNPDRDEELAATNRLRTMGVRTVIVRRTVPAKSGPRFYARLAGNLLSPLPYSVSSHTSSALVKAVRAFAAQNTVDVWHCEWTPYAQVLRDAFGDRIDQIRWCVMAHNVESVIWRRYAETTDNPLKRWYIRQQLHKFEQFERWAYSSATAAIAVSHTDAKRMQQEFGATRVHLVENGVDVNFFRPQRDVERKPTQMLFLGSLDWRPNQDAAQELLTNLLPRIRSRVPEATVVVVGRRPPAWLRELVTATPGAQLHANVPDVRPFLARCGFLIVPLRIGGGSRLKILEALATGTPVVSTEIGAEGLELVRERHLLTASTPDELVNAALATIQRPDEAAELAEAGRRQVADRYSWELLAERLDCVWQSVARMPAAVRL